MLKISHRFAIPALTGGFLLAGCTAEHSAPSVPPLQPGQVRPADVLIPDQKIDFPRPPNRFKAVQGWAQAVTMSKNQRGENALLEMDFLRLREEDPATGATIVVAEAAFDFEAVPLPCVPAGRCDGGLWERDPWFGSDAHIEMWNSAVTQGILQINIAQTPNKVAHWWTSRSLNKADRRYFIETRFRITGQAALQLGVDYWVALDSQWTEPQDVRCERGNNCQGWASIWFGDTGGAFVTKIVPLY